MIKKFASVLFFSCATVTFTAAMPDARCVAQEAEATEQAEVTYEMKAMETLGSTLVAYCFEAHVNVGLVADSYEGEAIDEERAKSLIELNINLLDQVGPAVVALTKFEGVGEADLEVFKKLAGMFKLIKAEANAVKKYIESGEEADLKAFGEKNQAAQKAIDAFVTESSGQ